MAKSRNELLWGMDVKVLYRRIDGDLDVVLADGMGKRMDRHIKGVVRLLDTTDEEFNDILDEIVNEFYNTASKILGKHCMDIEHY